MKRLIKNRIKSKYQKKKRKKRAETSNYLIGKTPEEHRNDNASPELSHDIEQTETPNSHNRKRPKKPGSEDVEQLISEGLRVNIIAERVQNKPKSPKEGYKWHNHGIEKRLLGQNIRQLGVQQHEPNSHRQVHPSFEKRNNLRAAPFGRHDKDVLRVS